MNSDKCRYSYHEVRIPDLHFASYDEYPVECPDCGAIRKLQVVGGTITNYQLPEHNTLMGTARERKRWKQVDRKWQIVG